jgi:hypothetical protein
MAQSATWVSVMTAAIPDDRSQLVQAALSDETSSAVFRLPSIHHSFNNQSPPSHFDTTTIPRPGAMDFATTSHQPMYNQADLDQAFNSLQTVDNASPSHHLSQTISQHNFDHSESREADHPSYDLFSNNNNNFASQRYRANSSSSSSLGPPYAMSPDGVYSHASFGDSVPSFGSSSTYDMMSNVSYSSGKVSPLTPNDAMTGIQQSPVFPHSLGINGHQKDFSNGHSYPELINDRRVSGVSGTGFHNDFSDDYGMNGGAGYPPSALQPFQDRMRLQPDSRFSHSGLPPSVPSHMGHSPDMFRGVAPQATHSFRPDSGLPGYDDVQYFGNPHADMSLRMPGIGDGFPGMRNGHPGMGSSNDLQAFIR